ncbi:MAG TPA: hypothetical protein PLL10_00495 [Elusimicrobiales bacterium]|nr:hypothetical protein [Elusimicrobiales bacterium]
MSALLLSCLLAVNASAAPVKKEKKTVQPKTRQALVEGVCSFEVPQNWQLEPAPYVKQTGVPGITASAPGISAEQLASISVSYYPPNNKIYGSSTAYISKQTEPGLSPVGRKVGKPQPARLGALEASVMELETLLLYPPEALSPKKVPVKEKIVVADAGKGFFVVRCSAAKSLYVRMSKHFDAALRTFKQQFPAVSPK